MEGLVLLTGVAAGEPFACSSPNQLEDLAVGILPHWNVVCTLLSVEYRILFSDERSWKGRPTFTLRPIYNCSSWSYFQMRSASRVQLMQTVDYRVALLFPFKVVIRKVQETLPVIHLNGVAALSNVIAHITLDDGLSHGR